MTISCMIILGIVTAGLLSCALTRHFLFFAVNRGIMDVPNGRSLHTTPTPRAGGISFFAVFTTAFFILLTVHLISVREVLALSCGILIGLVGYWDDRIGLSPAFRMAVHISASILAVFCLGGFVPIRYWDFLVPPLVLAAAVVIALVWLTNLTNFMDGIDGITSIEAITFFTFCGIMIAHRSGFNGLAILCFVFTAAVVGFLVWNWPPAKIYMGDIGSGFLGFTIGVMAYLAISQHELTVWPPLILYGVFIVDATFTLSRRMLCGERWYSAHRTHAFQHAALRWGHKNITLSVAVINVLWLGPWALLSNAWPSRGPILLLVAWTPLVGVAIRLRAGRSPEHSSLKSSPHYSVDVIKDIL